MCINLHIINPNIGASKAQHSCFILLIFSLSLFTYENVLFFLRWKRVVLLKQRLDFNEMLFI